MPKPKRVRKLSKQERGNSRYAGQSPLALDIERLEGLVARIEAMRTQVSPMPCGVSIADHAASLSAPQPSAVDVGKQFESVAAAHKYLENAQASHFAMLEAYNQTYPTSPDFGAALTNLRSTTDNLINARDQFLRVCRNI